MRNTIDNHVYIKDGHYYLEADASHIRFFRIMGDLFPPDMDLKTLSVIRSIGCKRIQKEEVKQLSNLKKKFIRLHQMEIIAYKLLKKEPCS